MLGAPKSVCNGSGLLLLSSDHLFRRCRLELCREGDHSNFEEPVGSHLNEGSFFIPSF